MTTSPINIDLLGENGNTLKLKTTAKLNNKQTSIATVPYETYRENMTPSRPHLFLITDYVLLKGMGHEGDFKTIDKNGNI